MNAQKHVRRFDLGQIQSVEKTPQGFLKIPGFVTRTGVFVYLDSKGSTRRELRHPDDVNDPESLVTLKNCVVTLEHPPVMVDPENFKQYSRGYTTDRVEVNRDLVETDLIVAAKDAIGAVEDKGVREISSGYTCDLEEAEGTYNGAQYNYRQRNIRYNHVALVKKGRAGPEVRLRMDSDDAKMKPLDEEEGTQMSEEKQELKAVVIGGESIDLPARIAAIVQDMMDRYDQIRSESAQSKENNTMPENKKTDVDVNQKGISPQVDVTQMAPDGRSAPSKVGASDTSGPAKAKGDADMPAGMDPSKKDGDMPTPPAGDAKKNDFEAPNGAGASQSPLDMLKKSLAEMASILQGMGSKNDELQAKVDEYASKTIATGQPGAGKMDSADFRTQVTARVRLEKAAEKMVPTSVVQKFDSMSNDEIRVAVIQHRHPNVDLKGKSSVYLETRFDAMAESFVEGIAVRKEMGAALLAGRMDSQEKTPDQARRAMIAEQQNAWKSNLSNFKK